MSCPHLVLLSGWGIDHRIWQSLEECWPNGTNVLSIDWPGYGDTPALPANATLAQLAEPMANVLPSDSVWVGWSLGGLLATALLDYLPAPKGLILLGAGATFCADDGVSQTQLGSFQRAFSRDPEATWRHFLRWQAQGEPNARKAYQQLQGLLGDAPNADHATLSCGLEWLAKLDNHTRLATIACPVVMLNGEQDPLMSPDQREAGEQLSGVGHCPMLSQPHQLAATLTHHASQMANVSAEAL